MYELNEVNGSNGTQWVVGKDNSLSTLYYFNTKEEAQKKLVELNKSGTSF